MNKLVLIIAVLMASVCIFASCEKEDSSNNNKLMNNNVKAANYVLMQKGYVDEYGNIGDLYVDENNQKNMYFEIFEQPQIRSHEQPKPYDGTLKAIYVDGYLDRYECSGEPTNCWNGVVNGNPSVSFPTGTKPIDVYTFTLVP